MKAGSAGRNGRFWPWPKDPVCCTAPNVRGYRRGAAGMPLPYHEGRGFPPEAPFFLWTLRGIGGRRHGTT